MGVQTQENREMTGETVGSISSERCCHTSSTPCTDFVIQSHLVSFFYTVSKVCTVPREIDASNVAIMYVYIHVICTFGS